jgi:hypothetical protein
MGSFNFSCPTNLGIRGNFAIIAEEGQPQDADQCKYCKRELPKPLLKIPQQSSWNPLAEAPADVERGERFLIIYAAFCFIMKTY